jgi:hypothetical protein
MDPIAIIAVLAIGAVAGWLITQPEVWTFICGHQSALVLLKLT